MRLVIPAPLVSVCLATAAIAMPSLEARSDYSAASQAALYRVKASAADIIKNAMLGSIRTIWEQGTAAAGILEIENPEYSVFADSPFTRNDKLPVDTLILALSAAVRIGPDGRLSQNINDGLDGAALDGASAGPYVLLGTFAGTTRANFFQDAADKQLNFLLNTAPKTFTGAISMQISGHAYWSDGIFMGPPFLAYYGAVTKEQYLLQMAFDNIRLYRDALLVDAPTGKLWGHIYSEDSNAWVDRGIWGTGNGWAALGMLRVHETIRKSVFADQMQDQMNQLKSWVKEILDGCLPTIRDSDSLIPDYLDRDDTFGDASSSAALASVAYRAAVIDPDIFGSYYTDSAGRLANAVLGGVDDLGVVSPMVNPLIWDQVGILSTEGQAFCLMMMAAWRAWLVAVGQNVTP